MTNLFGEEITKIESFTDSGKFYEVNKNKKTCSCPAFTKRPSAMCKHLRQVLGIKSSEDGGINKSLLKSATQKAVRRGNIENAVICAKAAIKSNFQDFARRAPVIVMEDAILHPKFADMLEVTKKTSRKSYEFDEEDANLLINIMADCAATKIRDDFLFVNEDAKILYSSWKEPRELTDEEFRTVNAIKYRSKIGGLAFDVKLFIQMGTAWDYRFRCKGWTIEKIEKLFPIKHNFKFKEIPEIQERNVELSGVDFHCSPLLTILNRKDYVVNLCKKLYPELETEKILQEVIWKMRSSVNTKKQLNGEYVDFLEKKYCDNPYYGEEHRAKFEEIFEAIKVESDSISKWFIKKQFERVQK